MSKLEELLLLSDKDPESFDKYIYSIADTIDDTEKLLVNIPFNLKKELIAGYQVNYGYRVVTEKMKEGGQRHHHEVVVYSIFSFLNKPVTEDATILKDVKTSILNKLQD